MRPPRVLIHPACAAVRERGAGGEWECVATLEGHENEVKCVAWSPCGAYLASCGRDKSVWVWETHTDGDFECAAVLHGHGADVKHVAWHPTAAAEKPALLSASYDDSLRVWQPAGGTDEWDCVQVLPGAAAAAKDAAAASRAASKKLGHSEDETVAAAADAAAAAAEAAGGHASTVWAAAWHPNGSRVVSVSDDRSLRLWRVKAECALVPQAARLDAHSRAVFCVDWAHNGRYICTGGGDDAIRVWEEPGDAAPSGEALNLVAEVPGAHESDVNAVAWHPDAQRGWLASASDDGTVKVWALGGCRGDEMAIDP